MGICFERLAGSYRVGGPVGEADELDIPLGIFPIWTEGQDKPQRGRLRFGVYIGQWYQPNLWYIINSFLV